MVQDLGLEGVNVLSARAEDLGRAPATRERYDLVTARAVAELRVLAEYGLPLLRVGGRMLAPKGAAAHAEVTAAARAIALLGGELLAVESIDIPGLDSHALVRIAKVRPTDPRSPRPAGVPRQKPL
jgi:16S rRNA (guanine527-N7)-methyltransferase